MTRYLTNYLSNHKFILYPRVMKGGFRGIFPLTSGVLGVVRTKCVSCYYEKILFIIARHNSREAAKKKNDKSDKIICQKLVTSRKSDKIICQKFVTSRKSDKIICQKLVTSRKSDKIICQKFVTSRKATK